VHHIIILPPPSPQLPSGAHAGELEVEEAVQLFPKQQGEELMGEKIADYAIMEAGDMVKGSI